MIFFIIGGLLCTLNYFKIEISSNQECYMALAKWWADPSWIPGSFLLSDVAGTRIGLNFIMSPFWQFGSFETVTITATFINLFLTGGALLLIAKEIRRPSLIAIVLFHLVMFSRLGYRSFYSSEWMFGGAEPKTFCYFFVLLGVFYFVRKKFIPAYLYLAVASHFHALIAGWVFLIFIIDNLLKDNFKTAFKNGIVFALGILPFVIYMLSAWFNKGVNSYSAEADNLFISSIHSHLKPWLVQGKEQRFFLGLFYAFLAACFAYYRHDKVDPKSATLYRLSIYAFLIPAVQAIFAPFEWFTPFLKLFPFRLTMMQKVLFFIPMIMEISLKLETLKWKKHITILATIILVITGFIRINKNIVKRFNYFQDPEVLKIAEYLSLHYKPGTKVMYLDASVTLPDDKLDSLGRLARVDVFYVNKLMPFSPERILEWGRRKKITKKIQEDINQIDLLKNENIEVVISKKYLPLELVQEISDFKIYNFKESRT